MAPGEHAALSLRLFVAEARIDADSARREAARALDRAHAAGTSPSPTDAVLIGRHLNRFYSTERSG